MSENYGSAFKKLVIPGTLEGSRLYVEIDWSGKKLSICGHNTGGAGQIDFNPADVLCAPGWTPFDVARLKEIWDAWHLNDMNAGCAHQRALGWGKKELELVTYASPDPKFGDSISHAELSRMGSMLKDKRGMSPLTGKGIWGLVREIHEVHIAKPKNPDDPRVLWFAEKFNCKRKVEKKTDGWVYPTEHPEGKMGKPCPTCGYPYGTKWLHEDVPADVIEWLRSLPEIETGGRSSYEVDADDFLGKHGISFTPNLVNRKKCPIWCDGKDHTHGNCYTITFVRNGSELFSLDFWNSMNDAAEGKAPTAYDVLSAITKSDPGSFEDFCADFGYDSDSRKAEKTYGLVVREWEKVSAFFTEEELEEAQEIN